MVARCLSCRAPSGREFPVVLLGDVVIAPEMACKEPGLGWLEIEGVPRLSMDASRRLERVIDGLRIGSWPFSAPLERWNEAAEVYPCLAVGIDDEAATSVLASCEFASSDLGTSNQDVAMDLRSERSQAGLGLMTGDRLRSRSRGVAELFIGIRRALGLMASGLVLAACVYYLLGTVGWLWSLRDGITSDEIQSGLVLILAALVFSGTTRALGHRLTPNVTLSPKVDSDDRQTVVSQLPGVYRAGVTLQLLAFLGFVIW